MEVKMHQHACDDCGEEFDCFDAMCAKAYEWDTDPESDYWGEASHCPECKEYKMVGLSSGYALAFMEA